MASPSMFFEPEQARGSKREALLARCCSCHRKPILADMSSSQAIHHAKLTNYRLQKVPRNMESFSHQKKRVQGEDSEEEGRPPAPQMTPWLVCLSDQGKHGKSQIFFSMKENKKYLKRIPEMSRKSCLMVSQFGWLLMKNIKTKDCYLLNSASMKVVELPPLPPPSSYTSPLPYGCACILSAPPADPNSVLCFFDREQPRALHCHLIKKKWVSTEYELDNDQSTVVDVTLCNGHIYGYTSNGKLVTIKFNPHPTLSLTNVRLSDDFQQSIYPSTFTLVESCGALYLVCTSFDGCYEIVCKFTILKMDFSVMEWMLVDNIGDHIFFLSQAKGSSSLSCSANETAGKVKGNSIYYVLSKDSCIYQYDVDNGIIIENDLLFDKQSSPRFETYWVLPPSSV